MTTYTDFQKSQKSAALTIWDHIAKKPPPRLFEMMADQAENTGDQDTIPTMADRLERDLRANYLRIRDTVLTQLSSSAATAVTGNTPGSDSGLPSLGPLEAFGNWGSVASTIMYYVEQTSNFNPFSTTYDADAWDRFWNGLVSMPFLTNKHHLEWIGSEQGISVLPCNPTLDLSSILKPMISPYLDSPSLSSIITTAKKMAYLASLNPSDKTYAYKKTYHQLGIIGTKENKLSTGIIRLNAGLTSGNCFHTKYSYTTSEYYDLIDFNINYYTAFLDMDYCKQHANTLLQWAHLNLNHWDHRSNSIDCPPNGCLN